MFARTSRCVLLQDCFKTVFVHSLDLFASQICGLAKLVFGEACPLPVSKHGRGSGMDLTGFGHKS